MRVVHRTASVSEGPVHILHQAHEGGRAAGFPQDVVYYRIVCTDPGTWYPVDGTVVIVTDPVDCLMCLGQESY
jgi:hypothetical protein